jgi:hypothetical protein
MIVRVMGQGQYQIDEALADYLNELDDSVVDAVNTEDQELLTKTLGEIVSHVLSHGEPLADDDLQPSDMILPDPSATVAEVAELLSDSDGAGLVPEF